MRMHMCACVCACACARARVCVCVCVFPGHPAQEPRVLAQTLDLPTPLSQGCAPHLLTQGVTGRGSNGGTAPPSR